MKLAIAHLLETLPQFFCLEDKDFGGFFQCRRGKNKKRTFQWRRRVELDNVCHHRNSEHGHAHALCVPFTNTTPTLGIPWKMLLLVPSYSHISSYLSRG